tara:strand:- start:43 stop:1017 length:975 start_codon:yes stop_codon:yes gene_type:complete
MVLVKAEVGIRPTYSLGSSGPPILVTGGGGRGGGEPRGRTKREIGLSALGGTAGALGALTGQHRSLGGLVQSAISGGAQGASLGGALGRKFTGRERQARADLDEGTHSDYATARASGRLPKIEGFRFPPTSMKREALQGLAERDAAAKEAERLRQKTTGAAAAARGTEFGEADEMLAATGRAFTTQTGVTPQEYAHNMARMGAAVVNAKGENTGNAYELAQLPQNSKIGVAAPGSVGSNNQTADRVGQGVTDAQGFNNTTEGEPSDIPPPSTMRPPEGQGQLPGMTANEDAIQAWQRLQEEKERRMQEQQGTMAQSEQTTLGQF